MMGEFPESTRAAKRIKLLSEDEDSASDLDSSGGVGLNDQALSINQEYAKRFEHNSKRAELHRLEEKFGKEEGKRVQERDGASGNDSDDSTSASEDEDGILASGTLEAGFQATLKALKSKDARIYNPEAKFYDSADEDYATAPESKKEKPVYLSDYHRQNLLNGITADDEDRPPTYVQQQNALKESLVREMHAVETENESEDEGMFKVKKLPTPPPVPIDTITTADVEQADQDPETFLSRFLDSRAWVTNGANRGHIFESDDEEEDLRAEQFEEAYNLRFEKGDGLNEKLVSHARDTAAKYSVRDETKSRRQRGRESEKMKKEEERAERAREKAQLKKLRLEEFEKKWEKIKEAAGRMNKANKPEDWSELLAEDWNEDKYEQRMKSNFDEQYYAEQDVDMDEISSKKVSKPKWDDDIDVGDIVADLDEEARFSLSDDDRPKSKKQRKSAREDAKSEARKNKRKLEQMAEDEVNLELMMQEPDRKSKSRFRYRDTSPVSWGLNAQDILMASDTQLNQFAGLKKLASFRDVEKRRKDKKTLGKKARLRQWRKETFGNAEGPQQTIQDVMRETQDEGLVNSGAVLIDGNTGERKRSKKGKRDAAAA